MDPDSLYEAFVIFLQHIVDEGGTHDVIKSFEQVPHIGPLFEDIIKKGFTNSGETSFIDALNVYHHTQGLIDKFHQQPTHTIDKGVNRVSDIASEQQDASKGIPEMPSDATNFYIGLGVTLVVALILGASYYYYYHYLPSIKKEVLDKPFADVKEMNSTPLNDSNDALVPPKLTTCSQELNPSIPNSEGIVDQVDFIDINIFF